MSIVDKLNTIKACKEDIKQAISDKGVDMTDVAFTEYAQKISEIQSGGGSGDYIEIRNNLTSYSNSNIEEIPDYTFYGMSGLTTVNIPFCTNIGDNSFGNCFYLTDIDFQKVERINYGAFQYCRSLTKSLNNLPFLERIEGWAFYENNITSIDLPSCSEIDEYAFANNKNLTSINLPECKRLGGASFEYCYALTDINLPKCEDLEEGCFREISATSIEFPSCRNLGQDVFARCPNLTEVNLPVVDKIWYYPFVDCSNLTTVNAPTCSEIHSEAFARTALNSLDLSKTFYCSLEDINAFSGTPIENGEGTIYVHNAHISNFQNDPNWSNFTDRFVGVGDADKPLLAFADGKIYGETTSLADSYKNILGIDNTNLSTIDLPNLETIPNNYFDGFSSITTVNLPNCKTIGDFALVGIQTTTLDLPKCEIVGTGGIQNANQLTTVNLPQCHKLKNGVFANCPNLRTLYIGTELTDVCDANEGIYLTWEIEAIYVPAKLVDAYKNAPHWNNFADKIFEYTT
jgi:hypothetical protein